MKFTRNALLMALVVALAPPAFAQVATSDEAQTAAESWLRYVVQRDGAWGNNPTAQISAWTELRREDRLLGYCATVDPTGYIVVSALTDFPPITAYSTISDFDSSDKGMPTLIQDALDNRARFLIKHFGGLDATQLAEVKQYLPESNQRVWSILRSATEDVFTELHGGQRSPTVVGPLLCTSWNQTPPYNNSCPNMGCSWPAYGYANQNAYAGCVPIAMAQAMRYFCWPPFSDARYYDWVNMPEEIVWRNSRWELADGTPATAAQVTSVANLCGDAGAAFGIWITYGCGGTGAMGCDPVIPDARSRLDSNFYYVADTCLDRADHTLSQWWNVLTTEFNARRPVVYRIASPGWPTHEFDHEIVIDGYDNSGGQYRVHANYGWGGSHNTWYTLDNFDCNNAGGFQGGCDYNEEEAITRIFPETGLPVTGLVGPHVTGVLHPYVFADMPGNALLVQGGAWVQFLPDTSLYSVSTISVAGRSPDPTRLFSIKPPRTCGIRVYGGGGIHLYPNGEMRLH